MAYLTNLTKSGNSKAVRLPNAFIKLIDLEEAVEIDIKDDTIILSKPAKDNPKITLDRMLKGVTPDTASYGDFPVGDVGSEMIDD